MQLGLGNSLVMRNRPSGSSAPTVVPVLSAFPSDYTVNLNWSHSDMTDSPGFGYSVYRRVDGGSWDFRGDTSDDFWVENPSNYIEEGFFEFKVVPFNNFGTGPDSNIADVTLVWVDPLAADTFALRLQTHRGDGVPYGLFQDAAGTVPATSDGHPVGCWKDLISGSGLAAVQATATQRPTLRFDGSSLPYLEFDGVDDTMVITGFTAPAASTVLARMATKKFTFCKPWSHPSAQNVEVYTNDDGVLIMASGGNGPTWSVDEFQRYTHQCQYSGATSRWYINGTLNMALSLSSPAPGGNMEISMLHGVPASFLDMSVFAVAAGTLAEPATIHTYLESLQP